MPRGVTVDSLFVRDDGEEHRDTRKGTDPGFPSWTRVGSARTAANKSPPANTCGLAHLGCVCVLAHRSSSASVRNSPNTSVFE